jgi:hypothetical protein
MSFSILNVKFFSSIGFQILQLMARQLATGEPSLLLPKSTKVLHLSQMLTKSTTRWRPSACYAK